MRVDICDVVGEDM